MKLFSVVKTSITTHSSHTTFTEYPEGGQRKLHGPSVLGSISSGKRSCRPSPPCISEGNPFGFNENFSMERSLELL